MVIKIWLLTLLIFQINQMNPFIKSHKQKSIFITAGYPKINSLEGQIRLLEKYNIDFIEIGIPFSDPLADGPTIQKTSEIAINNGMNLPLLFDQLNSIKTKIPLVLMGYLNPVLNFGIEKFVIASKECGISSVILPDMSLEIYERFYQSIFEQYELPVSFLITPHTEISRIKKIAKECSRSFMYLVSSNSTTGTGSKLTLNEDSLKSIYGLIEGTPLMIGFGIKTKADIENVHQFADGAIIGSAYLQALEKGREVEFLERL